MTTPRARPTPRATPRATRDRNTGTPRARDRDRDNDAPPPLPAYEPCIAPLTASGHNAVLALLRSQTLRHLKTHLQHAGTKLGDSAGEVNDRLTDARVRYQRQKERQARRRNRGGVEGEGEGEGENVEEGEEGDGDGEGDGDAEAEMGRLSSLEERVTGVTKRMEEQVRKVVDAEMKVDALVEVMGGFEREAEEASVARPSRRQTRRRRDVDEDADEEDEGEDGDEVHEVTDDAAGGDAPSRRLDESLDKSHAQWDRLSLTQRYSANNTYVGFYRIVHDSQHHGNDIPPLPHASTWFSHLEDPPSSQYPSPSSTTSSPTQPPRQSRPQHQAAHPSSSPSSSRSSSIAIEREIISLKCPLTLLTFRDPVTSTKCPHSFERDAIESMLAQSRLTVPLPDLARSAGSTRSARRLRMVRCPVCSAFLTERDLESDPVLLRRIRREEALRAREDEDESGGEGSVGGRKRGRRGITVASGDEEEGNGDSEDSDEDGDEEDEERRRKRRATEERVRVKQERAVSSSARS